MHSLLRTASLHISRVLKWSGTYANESGSMRTASLQISCVLRRSGTTFIQLALFIYVFRPGRGSNIMTEEMIHDDTVYRSLQSVHLSMQNPMKM